MTTTLALQPWDKRAAETPRAFQLFTIYREMGPTRSVRKVAREAGTGASQVGVFSSTHDWVDRAAAWDIEQDRVLQLESLEAVKVMRREHTNLARLMLGKAAQRIQKIEPDLLTIREAVMLADLGYRLERLTRGEVTASINIDATVEVKSGPTGAEILRAIAANPDLITFADAFQDAIEASAVEL